MNLIKPNFIKRENKNIAIFSLSNNDDVKFPKRYGRAIRNLKKRYNSVIEWKNEKNYNDQFIDFLRDDSIDILMSLTGGYTTNTKLDSLNYNVISQFPKVIVGYSDTTALLLALYTKINMVTFYGPALLGNFGEYPDVNSYTLNSFNELIRYRNGKFVYQEPKIQSMSNYYWDKEDMQFLNYEKFSGWKSNKCGCVDGKLVGGNLNTLLSLLGTEYFPDLTDKILFIEDAYTTPDKFYRDMTTLKQNKIFDIINGMLVGSFLTNTYRQIEFETIINKFIKNKPLIYNVNFGHTNPIMTIPIGVNARIESDKRKIILLESPFK